MFATQVLAETLSDDDSEEENTSNVVGFLILGEKKYEVKTGETRIGRDSSMCSIVIENFTVSKVHAVIESEGIDDTFIYDVGSTNQTKLGKKVLKPHCRYKLDSESTVTLGNIIAKFILSPHKSSNSIIETKKSNSENFNPVDDLENIFEIPTQITIPETSTSKVPVFGKLSENVQILKKPNLVFPAGAKESLKSSKSIFEEMTQCRLVSQETTSKAVVHDSLFENSNIFNLSTQCQLYEENKCEENLDDNSNDKNNERDKIKSLLNDGQDDVLCTFMSLHSPKQQIKTEVENISEIFDVPTQVQPEIIQESPAQNEIKPIGSSNKDLNLDFSNRNLYKPSITSTPVICRNKSSHLNDVSENSNNCTERLEEDDFIKTQEFEVQGAKSINACKGLKSVSQDEETEPYLCETLNDLSATDQKSNDEDLILTQAFEGVGTQQNTKATKVVLESEDINEFEDFLATKIYDVNKAMLEKEASAKAKTPPRKNPDVDHHLDESLDFTQRNNDDVISTQVFEFAADVQKSEENLGRSNVDCDEDLIATQALEIPVNKNLQKSRAESSLRESSPDLLGFENTQKTGDSDSEDFINTQLFEAPECKTSSGINTKLFEQVNSSHFTKKTKNCILSQYKGTVTAESSGDETESDLEILLDQTETGNSRECNLRYFKTESENSSEPLETQKSDTNSSYIFENHVEKVDGINVNHKQQPVANLSDSDETDCEELAVIAPKHSVKQVPLGKMEFDEAQDLSLTLPHNSAEKTSDPDDVWLIGRESPKFEIESAPGSSLGPELLNSQNIVAYNRLQEDKNDEMEDFQIPSKIKKIEVGISESNENFTISRSEGRVDSPLKRPPDNNGLDVVPIKKSKTEPKNSEKQFLKLVQDHDIGQIQPSRTRNSLKMLTTENKPNKTDTSVTNAHPSSRRKTKTKKLNDDITPYLTIKKVETRRASSRGKIKEVSPKENKVKPKPVESSSRILRSSRRNNGNAPPLILAEDRIRNIPIRKSSRISRTKSEEYFKSSCVNIVFTGFDCKSLDEIISELGGKKTDDLSCGEVVVADKVRRTVKFLCAIGLGLPITSPEWLLSCRKERKFLNPWNFILKDEESEEKFNFELKTSLEKSKKVKLLQGFSIYATKNTKPPVKDMLAIVESCGGTPLFRPPDVWPKKTIIVSCLEDKHCWPLPKFRNIRIVHYEFILGGILRQKIDFKTYELR